MKYQNDRVVTIVYTTHWQRNRAHQMRLYLGWGPSTI